MKKQLKLVKKFHKKFNVPVLKNPSLIPKDRTNLRYYLIKNEVEEYLTGVEKKNHYLPHSTSMV